MRPKWERGGEILNGQVQYFICFYSLLFAVHLHVNLTDVFCINIKHLQKEAWVVCPNFRHPTLTLSFTKYKFFQVKK